MTYIDKRLLELDVKSVVRKGNDGILSTADILCALSMEFKERNLKNKEKEAVRALRPLNPVSKGGSGEA
jgi:hypothetical protein